MRHRLYKYYSEQKWADAFLDGEILFRALSYFREIEDSNIRGDQTEGVSRYRPDGGLVGYNHTQRRSFVLPHHAFESSAKADEIFVFCTSTRLDETLWTGFEATACVEILNIGAFCQRLKAALPRNATFFARRVKYYDASKPPEERWALPDLIATSKITDYAWQSEYRFVFSLTDALGFENVTTVLRSDNSLAGVPRREHPTFPLRIPALRDICRLAPWRGSTRSGGEIDYGGASHSVGE